MVLAVDNDEVLFDTIRIVLEYYNAKHDTNFTREDFKSYNLWETWNCTKEEAIAEWYAFWKSPYPNRISPVQGAIEGVGKLRAKNELVIVTSRQYEFARQTEESVSKYFPGKFLGVYFCNDLSLTGTKRKKSEICHEVGARVLIDDNLENAIDCVSHGIEVLLFDSPWNQTKNLPVGIERVHGWEGILNSKKFLSSPPV